ncbi:MAG: hypothetical protein MUC81_11220 [Bacteroidia bacterium]|jgi:tetratricopeptide (TPR) repeat protein|nr:hypothetical protein [Bacteroidia bacterium]
MRLIFYFLVLLFVACAPQQKLIKQARVQSAAGMHEEAANAYYNVLLIDTKNKEAKQGLMLNGQKVLADKFARFSKLVIEGQIADALSVYRFAAGYAKNAAKVGVQLEWPHEYDEVYLDIRNEYVDEQFDLAIALMTQRKYEMAEKVFERIATYDSGYANVSVLRLNTVLEPLYIQGLQAYQNGDFKKSYFIFNKIVTIDDGFKDAQKLKNASLQKATLLLGVMPVAISGKPVLNFQSLPDLVADQLSRNQDAYLKIANVQALHRDLFARGFKAPDKTDNAFLVGSSLNLGYVVLIAVDSVYYLKHPPKAIERDAFEAVTESVLNPYTQTYQNITRFKKAKFIDKTEAQQLFVTIRYALIKIADNQILLNETFSINKRDEIHAATTSANPAQLYPTLPEDNILPQLTPEWREMMLNPRKSLIPLSIWQEEINRELSQRISSKMMDLLK